MEAVSEPETPARLRIEGSFDRRPAALLLSDLDLDKLSSDRDPSAKLSDLALEGDGFALGDATSGRLENRTASDIELSRAGLVSEIALGAVEVGGHLARRSRRQLRAPPSFAV